MMTNIFTYATKELSQDGFLAWLFSNFKDPVIGKPAKNLFSRIVKLYGHTDINPEDIKKVKIYQQCQHMDIVIDLYINDDQCYSIVIEDKVKSKEHGSQLDVYNNKIKSWKSIEVFKVYYKLDNLDDDEKKRVIAAGWKIFDIKDIYDFFITYKNFDNLIVAQYVEHVIETKHDLEEVSTKDIKEWNQTNFKTFADKILGAYVKDSVADKDIEYWVSGYYNLYSTFTLRINKDYLGSVCPILEVRFRENYNIVGSIYLNDKSLKEHSWHMSDKSRQVREAVNQMLQSNNTFRKRNHKLCVATTKSIKLKDLDANSLKETIINWINEFKIFKEIKL